MGTRSTQNGHQRPACADLFAGAGGLAEGFRQAGWAVIAGADADPHASETFRLNFPRAEFYEGPIGAGLSRRLLRDLDLERGDLDCLIGSGVASGEFRITPKTGRSIVCFRDILDDC